MSLWLVILVFLFLFFGVAEGMVTGTALMFAAIDPVLLAAIGPAVVAIIGAFFGGVVLVINALGNVKLSLAAQIASNQAANQAKLVTVEKKTDDLHVLVNGSQEALKEQNERRTVEAVRVAASQATDAYAKGHAEGQLMALREMGTIRPQVPIIVAALNSTTDEPVAPPPVL